MKKVLIILSVLSVLAVGGLSVVGVLGFVGYRNMNPAVDKADVPDEVGEFRLIRVFPPKGNMWGTEMKYFSEYEKKGDAGQAVGITFVLNKYRTEAEAENDFGGNKCLREETIEKKGDLKDKSGRPAGMFRYCDGTLYFRNKTNSMTVFNFKLSGSGDHTGDDDVIGFVKNLAYNKDLDFKGFAEIYPTAAEDTPATTAENTPAAEDTPATTAESNPPAATGEVLNAYELAKKYKASKSSVSQYNGKEITIRGYILIPPTITQPSKGGLTSLGEKTETADGTINSISCWFGSEDEAKFAALKGDQYITVKGVFSGEYLAEIRHCKLVKAE